MTIFWLAAFIVFAIGEAVTVGLVSVWFAVGALAGLFAAALGAGLWLQIAVFLGVSALALALFKPLSSKLLKSKPSAQDVVIPAGRDVKVLRIEGVKVIVETV